MGMAACHRWLARAVEFWCGDNSGNAGSGISMDGGRLLFFGGEAATPGVIENNNYGISMNDAASATLYSAFYIANNASTGISVNGASSITFYSELTRREKILSP